MSSRPHHGLAQSLDVAKVRELLPVGNNEQNELQRLLLFKKFEREDCGWITRRSCRLALKFQLSLRNLEVLLDAAFNLAFDAARDFSPPIESRPLDTCSLDETGFWVCMLYLRRYVDLKEHLFGQAKLLVNADVTIKELELALPRLRSWNLAEADDWETSLSDCWKLLDPCDQGVVDADHFVDFCLRRVLVSMFLDVHAKHTDEFLTQRSCRQQTLYRCESTGSNAPNSSPLERTMSLSNTMKRRSLIHNVMIDWEQVDARLPLKDDVASRAARSELWRRFDVNGNGVCSLAEVDKGFKALLAGTGLEMSIPAINRAFYAARAIAPPVASFSNDYIDKNEFVFLLHYLKHYLELWELFNDIDTSNDRKIDLAEFTRALPLLQKWGVRQAHGWQASQAASEAAFNRFDYDGAGAILFDEFADVCLRMGMHLGIARGGSNADRAEALRILLKAGPNTSVGNIGHATPSGRRNATPYAGRNASYPATFRNRIRSGQSSASRPARGWGKKKEQAWDVKDKEHEWPDERHKAAPSKLSPEVLAATKSRASTKCRFCHSGSTETGCFGRFCHGEIYRGIHNGKAWGFRVPGPGFYADNLPTQFPMDHGQSSVADIAESPYSAWSVAATNSPATAQAVKWVPYNGKHSEMARMARTAPHSATFAADHQQQLKTTVPYSATSAGDPRWEPKTIVNSGYVSSVDPQWEPKTIVNLELPAEVEPKTIVDFETPAEVHAVIAQAKP